LVASLPRNTVSLAKLRHRPRSGVVFRDKANPFFHCAALLPWHRLILPSRQRAVTQLSGLLCHHPIRSAQASPSPLAGEGRAAAQMRGPACSVLVSPPHPALPGVPSPTRGEGAAQAATASFQTRCLHAIANGREGGGAASLYPHRTSQKRAE